MRLWSKDLISVLPRQQLLSQWRECCCIARNIAVKGTPNHILVNKIMDYPISHFIAYSELVCAEMERRGYKADRNCLYRYSAMADYKNAELDVKFCDIYNQWHDKRYLRQCFYNLQEKCDCGGISQREYGVLYERVWELLNGDL